jgi:hypothetical protein
VAADRKFFEELIARCWQAGIPVRAQIDDVVALLYAVVMAVLHEGVFGPDILNHAIDLELELIAAYCVGEIELQGQSPASSLPQPLEGTKQ